MLFSFPRLRLATACLGALVLFSGCVIHPSKLWPWGKKKPPRATLKVDQLMGTITLVNEESAFVLIDTGTLPSAVVGATLKVRTPGGEPAQVRVTQISKPPFVVADIVKGAPKKGEQVYQ